MVVLGAVVFVCTNLPKPFINVSTNSPPDQIIAPGFDILLFSADKTLQKVRGNLCADRWETKSLRKISMYVVEDDLYVVVRGAVVFTWTNMLKYFLINESSNTSSSRSYLISQHVLNSGDDSLHKFRAINAPDAGKREKLRKESMWLFVVVRWCL